MVNLNKPLNLNHLSKIIKKNLSPNLETKTWLKLRLPPENYYIAFYKSGKFLINGVKIPDQINNVAERILVILKDYDKEIKLVKIELKD